MVAGLGIEPKSEAYETSMVPHHSPAWLRDQDSNLKLVDLCAHCDSNFTIARSPERVLTPRLLLERQRSWPLDDREILDKRVLGVCRLNLVTQFYHRRTPLVKE